LAALYNASIRGEPAELPELPIQYADYAVWEREQLHNGSLDHDMAHWREQLRDEPPMLQLPFARLSAADRSHIAARKSFELPFELTVAFREFCRKQRVTVFTAVVALFQTLLHRYTGLDDIAVGTPVACREPMETEPVIGFFANTVVLRTKLEGDLTFTELLDRVRDTTVNAFAHQQLPFDKLVEVLSPGRSRSGSRSESPFFEVMIDAAGPSYQAEFTGFQISRLEISKRIAVFDLTLFVAEPDDRIRFTIEYAIEVFEKEAIERMQEHFQILLEAAVFDPGRQLRALPLLTAAEKHQLIVERNLLSVDVPPRLIHQLIEERAAQFPNKRALIFEDPLTRLTYSELNAEANRLARFLQELGVGPNVVVSIGLERSIEMVVAVLGVFKAGGAYLPLDPTYPPDRLQFMQGRASASLLLTHSDLKDRLSSTGVRTICIDAESRTISGKDEANLTSTAQPDDLAYLIFTSGSTGPPKAVEIEHRNLSNFLQSAPRQVNLTDADRVLAISNLTFDAAVIDLLLPLTQGAEVTVAAAEDVRDLSRIMRRLDVGDTTFMLATPSMWQAMMDTGWKGNPCLKAICGGEALSPNLAESLSTRFLEVWNLYGPTEATVAATWERVQTNPEHRITIGRPLSNVRVYVLDRNMQAVPTGVRGELYIGGAGVGRGYRGEPQLTTQSFVPDPFAGEHRRRLYRTGDVVRYLSDGRLEFCGRTDHQVKLRGYRIELGEIETVLREQPGIKDAIVDVREDSGNKQLIAYIIHDRQYDFSTLVTELKSRLRAKLPQPMIPSSFFATESFPLTTHGKIDRRALQSLAMTSTLRARESEESRTPVEELLLGLWIEVLAQPSIGIHDNFFEIGGHSLLAIRLMTRVNQTFQTTLPLRVLFDFPTIAELGGHLSSRRSKSEMGLPILRRPHPGRQIMSFAQQRLWVLEQIEPAKSAYHVPMVYRLNGSLDVKSLEQSLNAMVQRHEVLRTSFGWVDGLAIQIVAENDYVPLVVDDVSQLSQDQRQAEATRLVAKSLDQPFDLKSGPVLRSRLIRVSPDEHVLAITVHHISFDGWSADIFLSELATFYAAALKGEPARLEELPVQYADFAAWQREWLQGDIVDAQLEYWRKQLGTGTVTNDLPSDRPRKLNPDRPAGRQSVQFSVELLESLIALSKRSRVTLFMTLLAAFKTLLYRYTGETDIRVGTPIANRSNLQVEKLIGFFANTLVIRSDFSGNPTFARLVERVRETCLQAYENQDIPFERLVEELDPQRDLSRSPLFQTMFVLEQQRLRPREWPGLKLTRRGERNANVKFDLTLTMVEADDGLRATLSYDADLFDAQRIRRMLDHLGVVLHAIVLDPDQSVAHLPIITESERRLLLDWNRTGSPVQSRLVHHFLEDRARTDPNSEAITFEGRTLNYAELNSRANRLAHYLRERGAGPEVLVGVAIERSPEMLVALLAISKAGAAYMPLDVTYPIDRLHFMIDDSGMALLLTDSRHSERLGSTAVTSVQLDVDEAKIAAEPDCNLLDEATPDTLAYVLYTSGSSGRPKGVEVTHRSLTNLLLSMHASLAMTSAETMLAATTISFDIAGLELYLPLIAGSRIALVSRETAADGPQLAAKIASLGVTMIQATPTTLQMLIAAGWKGDPNLKVLSAGEPLSRDLADRLRQRAGAVWNGYGPTETTIYSTLSSVEAAGPIQIGRPIANTQTHILDANFEPAPVGVPGELYIGGAGLARGYRRRPDLTADRFMLNPFEKGSDRLYRTGDLARYCADGSIEWLARVDQQVKIRGVRVELGEIEEVLRQQDAVRDVVVAARQDLSGNMQLVAYIVGKDVVPSDLRVFLKSKLPDFMIPTAFVPMENLPVGPTGKTDRKALPAPDRRDMMGASEFVAPKSVTEMRLAKLWADVLGVERVGIRDNFFELGGHSLTAVQLFQEMTKLWGRDLPLATLFAAPTIEKLIEVLAEKEWKPTWECVVPIRPDGTKEPFYCVHGVGGNVVEYYHLARYLDPERPFYGIQARGVSDAERAVAVTLPLEEIARDYIAQIRAFQPKGPYFLGGSSFGGLVAFEMAQQLTKAGEEIGILALFDTYGPGYGARRRQSSGGWWGMLKIRAGMHVGNLQLLRGRERKEYLREKSMRLRRRLKRFSSRLIKRYLKANVVDEQRKTIPEAFWHVQDIGRHAQQNYRPQQPYPGVVSLFRATYGPKEMLEDEVNGWTKWVSGTINVRAVPGHHGAIVREPRVRVLAKELNAALASPERYIIGER